MDHDRIIYSTFKEVDENGQVVLKPYEIIPDKLARGSQDQEIVYVTLQSMRDQTRSHETSHRGFKWRITRIFSCCLLNNPHKATHVIGNS
ncbi:hypothetical protein Ciccas_005990 [Cichlidogyrus casuarinus]|uniref:Uncharacterized protein n=1 Tax=Cichlidogyrus casuarinus TaxID=1844966 RepID=A0ABD2Q735_9PLAT